MKYLLHGIVLHPRIVLLAWLLLGGLLTVLAWYLHPYLPPDTGDFLPEHTPTVQGYRLLREAFPDIASESSVVLVFHSQAPFQASERQLAQNLEECLEQLKRSRPELGLGRFLTWLHPFLGPRLLSADSQCALAIVHLDKPFIHDLTTETVHEIETIARRLLEQHHVLQHRTVPIELAITGTAGFGRDLNVAIYHSLDITTWATVILILALLFLAYSNPWIALVPLVSISVAVWVSLRLLEILCVLLGTPLVNMARIFVVVVLFGAGTDYCLFLISRFREEIYTRSAEQAMGVALRRVCLALLASAGVVMVGLAMMGFAEFARVSTVGPFVAISLGVALAAALTLAPACLLEIQRWQRTALAPLSSDCVKPHVPANRFWLRVSQWVGAYPHYVLLGSFLLMLPLAWYGAVTEAVMDVCAEVQPYAPSRRGLDIIRQHFPAGELGPLTILLVAPPDVSDHKLREHLLAISQRLSQLDNIQDVRSLVRPLGKLNATRPDKSASSSWTPWLDTVNWLTSQLASSYYVRRLSDKCVSRLEVVFETEPFSKASVATLQQIRQTVESFIEPQGVFRSAAMHGITLFIHDLSKVHESDRWRINTLVLLSILIILTAVVGSFGWASYLLATVLFSYFVTLGIVSIIGPWWLGTAIGVTDWKVPYFLFVILVAVGEDYNIFLMSRVREEQRRLGLYIGVQQALACTGSTISMCGIIMAGAFATMMLSELITLFQLGLALSIGVLLETFVVRPILVPAGFLTWYNVKNQFFSTWTKSAVETTRVSGKCTNTPTVDMEPANRLNQ
ncbi:MAG: MMPL family transporter [Gemmatales bacterium]|nr:MMPL family transporter [Gemmatales bacterium]MDW7995834.1 MMPL family transporter [Gemmatales bacterium]